MMRAFEAANASEVRWIYLLLLMVALSTANGIRIRNFLVPDRVNINSTDRISLDCSFEFDGGSEGSDSSVYKFLVIKWSLNNSLIYQWSFNQTFVSNLIKDKILEEHRPQSTSRPTNLPLTILNKTVDLTGLYECKVQLIGPEDTRQKYMYVYVPGQEIVLKENLDEESNLLNVSCSAEGVYPQPVISMVVDNHRLENASEYVVNNRDPLYDINATYSIQTDDLPSYTIFNCSLSIPEVNLTYSKTLRYIKAGYDFSGNGNPPFEQEAQDNGASSIRWCNMELMLIAALVSLLQAACS